MNRPHWMGEAEERWELDQLERDRIAQEMEDDTDRRVDGRYSDERSEPWPTR